jgi:AcrR family transcriptional regulator
VPKLIDHAARRAELGAAVIRVIARDGVGAVSVRTVAAEAGSSAGSLRHVLPSKGLLLAAAMEVVVARGTARFLDLELQIGTRADAIRWLEQMLPLDQERRLEMQIHLALVTESAAHPELGDLRSAPDDALGAGCRHVLLACDRAGLLRRGLDLEGEALRLQILVDGLAFHLLGPGSRIDPAGARALLDEHLGPRWRRGAA